MSLDQAKTSGLVNLNYVVMSYLLRANDFTMRNYKKFLQLVIDGYRDMNLYSVTNIEVQYLLMDENKTVDVPDDFIDYTKIGIPKNGKLVVLTRDKTILLPRSFEDGTEVGNVDATRVNLGFYFADHFRNGRYVGGLYGMTGGFNQAYYRYDKELRQIIFTGDIPQSQIVLEYVSSGIKLSGTTLIPVQYVAALRAYVAWQQVEFDMKVPLSIKERRERQYIDECEAVKFMEHAPTKEELRDYIYRTFRQTPKR